MLQEKERNLITSGIVYFFFSPVLAIVLDAFIAYPLGLQGTVPFYALWALLALASIGMIAAGIKEKRERKQNQNA